MEISNRQHNTRRQRCIPINKPVATMAPKSRAKEDSSREMDDGRPTVAALDGENPFAQLAKTWLKSSKKPTKVKVKPDLLKSDIWDVLEKEGFEFKSLLMLENLQILEKYGPPPLHVAHC
jgi:intron-binding protein aquarius